MELRLPKLPPTDLVRYAAGVIGALLVLVLGRGLAARAAARRVAPAVVQAPATRGPLNACCSVSTRRRRAAVGTPLVAMREDLRDPAALEVHLINVQRPVSGDVSSFVSAQARSTSITRSAAMRL